MRWAIIQTSVFINTSVAELHVRLQHGCVQDQACIGLPDRKHRRRPGLFYISSSYRIVRMHYVTWLKLCEKCAVGMPPSSKKVSFPFTFPLGLQLFCTKLYWKYSFTFFTFHHISSIFMILHSKEFFQMRLLDLLEGWEFEKVKLCHTRGFKCSLSHSWLVVMLILKYCRLKMKKEYSAVHLSAHISS